MDFIRRRLRPGPPQPKGPELSELGPGWQQIDRHLEALYGVPTPFEWRTIKRWHEGGPDPLYNVSVHENPGPPGHWHYVSYGLSELFGRESDDPDRSGWGIELTFRLLQPSGIQGGHTHAPRWPISLMQNLARYVFEYGNVLWPGHHMDSNGPIAKDADTELRATAYVEDPELGSIDTPDGSVRFVQIVGIALDEYEAIRRWNTDSVIELLRRNNPLLVNDLARRSILADPAVAAEVEAGRQRDGSSMGGVYLDRLAWSETGETLELTMGAGAVEDWRIMLEGRLAFGREAFIQDANGRVDLVPGHAFGWHRHGEHGLGLTVSPAIANELAELPTKAGRYTWPSAPGLTLIVEQTIVTNQAGEEIARIG